MSILETLNKHVIAQNSAKREIAQALYYHNLKYQKPLETKSIHSVPLMFVGPTGSGKTFIVERACASLDLIFLHVNTASMVPEGIKGYSLESIGRELYTKSDGDIKKMQSAVIFFDEIDKLFIEDNSDSQFGSKTGAQLLRLLEGGELKIYEKQSIDTKNMLFILGGAFQSFIDEKSIKKHAVGFLEKNDDEKNIEIEMQDLYDYGIPKELLGRVGSIVNLKTLQQNDYYDILIKSENSPLKEFIHKIEFHNNRVMISDETLYKVAQEAVKSKLGARALRQILKPLFEEALFEAPSVQNKQYEIRF